MLRKLTKQKLANTKTGCKIGNIKNNFALHSPQKSINFRFFRQKFEFFWNFQDRRTPRRKGGVKKFLCVHILLPHTSTDSTYIYRLYPSTIALSIPGIKKIRASFPKKSINFRFFRQNFEKFWNLQDRRTPRRQI